MNRTSEHVVLCPMRIEHRAVVRAIRSAGLSQRDVSVVQTGIGALAIEQVLKALSSGSARPTGVLLAGVCGGLRHTAEVPPLACVLDRDGRYWPIGSDGWAVNANQHPNSIEDGRAFAGSGVRLIGVDELVPGPNEKQTLAEQTGADLVDMESHAFAANCERLGLRWTVVRGVSDRPEDVLPVEVLGWITSTGDARPVRAITDMLRKPSLIPHTATAFRRSARVLRGVGARVVDLILRSEAQRES